MAMNGFEKRPIAHDGGALKFLYCTVLGRIFLKLLTARFISKAAGCFLNSRLSKPLIKKFIKNNGITGEEYRLDSLTCFNDCFVRRLQDGARVIDYAPSSFISPCDGLLSAYKIADDTVLPIKQSSYTIQSLLKNPELCEKYRDGVCLVFRLCVDNYHRYCYLDNAVKGENIFIKGRLHTVRPIALEKRPVFSENCREYTVMQTENFGAVTQIEVGAMLVGRIKNLHGEGKCVRGEEKGMFLYGGSTIVLLLEKDKVAFPEELFEITQQNCEIPVKMGQKLAQAK